MIILLQDIQFEVWPKSTISFTVFFFFFFKPDFSDKNIITSFRKNFKIHERNSSAQDKLGYCVSFLEKKMRLRRCVSHPLETFIILRDKKELDKKKENTFITL